MAISRWIQSLDPADFTITVVAPSASPPVVSGIRITGGSGLAGRLLTFRQEAKQADVVHLHGAFDLKLTVIYLLLLLEKLRRHITGRPIRILLTPHGALSKQVFTRNSFKKKLYWHILDRTLTKQIRTAICSTPREAEELRGLMPQIRIEVIPLVVDQAAAEEPHGKGLRATQQNAVPLLCTLGRYDIDMKGLDLLIAAVKQLNSKGFPVKLRCIGYDRNHGIGELKDYVEFVGADEFVECAGPKFGDEKDLAIAECDIFCMPSRYESFGYALMEGMASGLPVLVGSGACVTSFFNDEQRQEMTVEPNAAAWSEAIRRVLSDPQSCQRHSAEALQDLRQMCSPARVGDLLKTIYRTVASQD